MIPRSLLLRAPLMKTGLAILTLLLDLGGCGGLNPKQVQAWDAFHDCRNVAPTASLTELPEDGRVAYRTQEGSEFSNMKACVERRGYECDLGSSGRSPYTYCYPKGSVTSEKIGEAARSGGRDRTASAPEFLKATASLCS